MNTLKINNLSFDFDVEAKDIYSNNYQLEYSEEKSTENEAVFVNEKKNTEVKVKFIYGESSLCIAFDASSGSFGGWDINRQFAPYDSLTLKLYDRNGIDKLMGGKFDLGEKSDCWTEAFQAKSFDELPVRIISLVMQKENTYYHMMPLCESDFKGEIKNSPDGCMRITLSPYRSGYMHIKGCAAIITWGSNPYEVVRQNVANGYDALGLKNVMTENKRCSEIFDYLGWCSWDGFREKVNSEGLYGKMREFNDKGVPVKWVLVDDGWYCEDFPHRKMLDYTEDPKKFPEGIKEFIKTAKEKYGMKYIGMWECYGGGWNGIDEDSAIVSKHPDTIDIFSDGAIFPKTDEAGAFIYWNRRHDHLSRSGVDFLKIDVENAMESCMHGRKAVGETARESLKAMEASVGLYFDGACINCTGMGQEAIWNRRVGMVNRNSADFVWNDVKTMNGFVNSNIYNSMYHSHFSVLDWDMMMSDAPSTRMNTVLHAISGGLMYLSDRPGETNPEVILPFCMSDGKLLKCDGAAMPSVDNFFVDSLTEKYALKAWNMCGSSGVLGLFNVFKGEEAVECEFKINDIYKINGDKFLLYDWYNRTTKISSGDEVHKITINPYEAFLFIAVPITDGMAVLGDTGKYISPAIVENKIENMLVLKEGCKLSVYSENEPTVQVNGETVSVEKDGDLYIVDCSDKKEKVIVLLTNKGGF